MHKFIGQFACAIEVPVGIAPLDDNVFPFNVAEITQTLVERVDAGRKSRSGNIKKKSDPRDIGRLLSTNRNAKCHKQRAKHQPKEFPFPAGAWCILRGVYFHLIIRSALASTLGGIV